MAKRSTAHLATFLPASKQDIDRFWSKAALTMDNERCWEWQAETDRAGYGRFTFQLMYLRSHRLAWALANGRAPNNCILHRCDNPACVNPDHLYEGTNQDNANDRLKRKRQAIGERHGMCKLKEDQVFEIKRLINQHVPKRRIARQYNVHRRLIDMIDKREVWKHL